MTLYEKVVSKGGKVSYVEHQEKGMGLQDINDDTLFLILATFVVGMLEHGASLYPQMSRKKRELQKLQSALVDCVKVTDLEVTPDKIDICVSMWNASIREAQKRLS